jgi:hypothetical protein
MLRRVGGQVSVRLVSVFEGGYVVADQQNGVAVVRTVPEDEQVVIHAC